MGGRKMKLPPYVESFTDRTWGGTYFYFRKRGHKRVRLPGLPWSPEFMAAYEAAKYGVPLTVSVGKSRPGSIAALCAAYYVSAAHSNLVPTTRRTYRLILEKFKAEHGDKSVATIARKDVQRMVDNRSEKPAAARMFLKVLRAAFNQAMLLEMRDDNPCHGVRGPKLKGDGFHTWTEDEIAQFEARHPIGTKARLAMSLLLYTGQRRGDVVTLGRQMVRNGVLTLTQKKTKVKLAIPLHPALVETISATPNNHLTFLVTEWGKTFTAAGFGNWFRDRCNEAELFHCSAHGLRKAACRRLAEAGCSANQIAAISGHRSLKEVERYTKAAEQARLAVDALERVYSAENRNATDLPKVGDTLGQNGEKRAITSD